MKHAPNYQDILSKIQQTPVPPVKKVAVAFSGGLDSCVGVELLKRVYQVQEIIPICVDIGQGDDELYAVKEKAKILSITPLIIHAKEEFCEDWLTKAIWANSNYNGYPVSTSMTRQLIAQLVAQKAYELGCDAILEGSTGKGNDQYRMHNVFTLFAPEATILVPVRDFNLTRQEEIVLSTAWGIPVTEEISGGDDKTLWCRSIASGAIGLNQVIPDSVWLWYEDPATTAYEPVTLTLEFTAGIPTKLNGAVLSLDMLIDQLNYVAGKQGIGLIDMCEDQIMGLKSRELYEAPAAHVLLKVHQDIEQFCLTKEEISAKKSIDAQWASLVYHGMWFHPLRAALDAFIEETQHVVNGTYTIRLYKGTITILDRQLATSLFYPEIRSISSVSFDQRWCADAAKVMGLPFIVLAKRKKEMYMKGKK